MKPKKSFRSFLALSGGVLIALSSAQATILYWDGATPAGDPTGGTGTWDTSTQNWDTALTGGSPSAWTIGDYAIFGTPAGTVTVGSGIITSGLQFNVHSYVIDASSNALTFATGNNTISTNFTSVAGNVTSINGTVGGTGANLLFAPVNPVDRPVGHIISFGGASSGGWSGTTTIDKNMIVRLQDTNQALLNTSSINLRGGTLLLTNIDTQNALNRVKDDAVINSYGGNIRTNNTVAAVAYTESLGELKLHGGNTTLIHGTNQNSGGSQLLSFSSITRAAGSFATLNVGSTFNANNMIRNAVVTTATTPGEIIGPWMIAGNATSQSEYTLYDASGNIVQLARTGANTITTEGSLPITWASNANWYYNGSPTLTANRVMNTLRTSNGAAYQLADYSLATNGLLAGGGNLTISVPTGTGYLTAAGNPGSDNAIYINSANGFINMGAPVKDNANPVTMVLTTGTNGGRLDMNAANTHTGGTVISSPAFRNGAEGQSTAPGGVNLGNANALGPNTTLLRMESGTLNTNAIAATVGKFEGFASAYLTGTGGTIFTVGNGTAANVTGDFAGTIHNVRLTKAGDGTQILSGTNVADNTTSQYTVNGGTLQFAKTSALINSNAASWTAAKIVANTGGTLAFNVGGTGEFTTGNVTTLLSNLGGLGGAVASGAGLQAGSRIGFDTTNAGGSFTVADAIANSSGAGGGAIGLTKLGTGSLILTNTNTYTGQTTISGGTLALTGTGSIANSSTIQINSSTTLDVTGLTGNFTLGSTQTLSGGGTILATGKTVTVNGTVSAGNSPGTITQNGGTYQLGADGNMNWQIHNANGAAGVGYDTVSLINGAVLDLSLLTTLDPYNINLWSLSGIGPDVNGEATNFNNTQNYMWTLISTGTAISGFDQNLFVINDGVINGTNGFTNALGGGTFSVGLADGNTDLVLNFTAIPEPKAALLGALGVFLLLRRRRS